MGDIISIFHGCMVWVETSSTRNHCSASFASLMMPISDPRDRFFYPHHTPMIDTFSCIPFDFNVFKHI